MSMRKILAWSWLGVIAAGIGYAAIVKHMFADIAIVVVGMLITAATIASIVEIIEGIIEG